MASRNDAMIRAFLLLTLVGAVFAGKKEQAPAKEDGAKEASGPGGSFDITKLGASGDGKTDSTKVEIKQAMRQACINDRVDRQLA
jgi:galacturan 1,4-alpha-galacturonidase